LLKKSFWLHLSREELRLCIRQSHPLCTRLRRSRAIFLSKKDIPTASTESNAFNKVVRIRLRRCGGEKRTTKSISQDFVFFCQKKVDDGVLRKRKQKVAKKWKTLKSF
jgi:hypothetical protein